MKLGWVLLLIVILVGLMGIMLSDRYVAEFSALSLVGLALGLRKLTWGMGSGDDEN